jgi:deazaflavin-dependent oxidoreductase (nitroreductase family)
MPMGATSLKGILFRRGLKVVGGVHALLYRASGGRVGARIWGLSILLLTTRGRKTGRPRTTPLCFLRDGEDLVVVASNGGMDWFPSWWLNLLREPHATIQVGRARRAIRGREATPEERVRLWAQLTSVAPGYLRYQERTSRTIPLGILQPADNRSAAVEQVALAPRRTPGARPVRQSHVDGGMDSVREVLG